ncbi:winged helix-turn-helix domain-containing protein [Alkalicoccus daliensis]|uniref:Transcriptional regulatory protein, C terminal n=1 Tax=Alkalicoccus daliensis TaxID=745820 RepID=A0A1H0HZT0_9BACI|nr:winged helix-turn-helix domain-containing protein [Alkalicoccus daliensis]SDO24728.1 Transcriptional regulatory protein, C terminal [Alkalicoccus daliensis]
MLDFHSEEYLVSLRGETIPLLRKEFMLLQYLHINSERTLSRDQLLQAVWPESFPTDRTVDDHIYRLRKKLKHWQESVLIETVKGRGYKLSLAAAPVFPLEGDPAFQNLAVSLLGRYHLFGQGEALDTLIRQKELGINIDIETEIIVAFMRGDFQQLLSNTHLPFSKRALYLLHIYFMFSTQKKQALAYLEKAVDLKVFSENTQMEAELLAAVLFSIIAEEYNNAEKHIRKAVQIVSSEEHGFYPFLQLNKLMLAMLQDNSAEIKKHQDHLHLFFEQKPYQRELGIFQVLTGLEEERKNKSGSRHIAQGMQTLHHSRFRSHQLLAITISRFFLSKYSFSASAENFISAAWDDITAEFDLELILRSTEAELQLYL